MMVGMTLGNHHIISPTHSMDYKTIMSMMFNPQIDSLTGLGVVKVECGSQFSVALTKSGAVYTWYVQHLSHTDLWQPFVPVLLLSVTRRRVCLLDYKGERGLPSAGPRLR